MILDIPLTGVRFAGAAVMLAAGVFAMHSVLALDLSRPLRDQITWLNSATLRRFLYGMAIMCMGWSIQQWYWWVAEVARVTESTDVLRRLVDISDITAIVYALVFVGVALMLSGWLSSRVGWLWPPVSITIVMVLIVIGARYG